MRIDNHGKYMYEIIKKLFPICRSITGEGFRKSLKILSNEIPLLKIKKFPSGSMAFDWEIPQEWIIRDAYVLDPEGKKIIDFKLNNLHLVGYSSKISKKMRLDELKKHLYTLPNQPNAIPYVTSYYQKNWGFCIEYEKYKKLKKGLYTVNIDSEFKKGFLEIGEIIIPGKSKKEIFFSTYICHPSMANNELSGPALAVALSKWLIKIKDKKYTYRIIFVPETIGSIAYLSKNINYLRKKTIAGFNLTCVGDNKAVSFLPSRNGDTLSDRVAIHVLENFSRKYKKYSWQDRGSDERQYCSPGVDLPIASIMRSKYGTYPEYHTSLDNLDFISPKGLQGSFDIYRQVIKSLELNIYPISKVKCEPQLGKRNLYHQISNKVNYSNSLLLDLLTYSDGKRDLIDIANILDVSIFDLFDAYKILEKEKLITNKPII